MGNDAAQREHLFVAWIKRQRQIYQERILSAPPMEVPLAVSHGDRGEAREPEDKNDWASGVPDGVIVAAAVLGACIACPIGTAADGVLGGFLAGFAGALVGEVAVAAIARLLRLVLRSSRWAW